MRDGKTGRREDGENDNSSTPRLLDSPTQFIPSDPPTLRPSVFLRLLQLSDSGFPTGGYAFSHGLEGLHGLGLVTGEAEVRGFVRAQVEEGLAGVELPALCHAHRAAAAGDLAGLLELDGLVEALKPVPVFRSGSARVGRRLLEAASPFLRDGLLDGYLAAIRERRGSGHHALAFGVTTWAAGADEATAALALAAVAVNGYVAAAVRLGLIGQSAAQQIVHDLQPLLIETAERAAHLSLDDLGGYLPLIDLAGLRQESLAGRLFAS